MGKQRGISGMHIAKPPKVKTSEHLAVWEPLVSASHLSSCSSESCPADIWESETVAANRVAAINPPINDTGTPMLRSRFLGRGCDEACFSEKKGSSVKRGESIQWMRGLVRISTGKAIQWRGPGHSVNRRTPKTEKLLSSSPPYRRYGPRCWNSVSTPDATRTCTTQLLKGSPYGISVSTPLAAQCSSTRDTLAATAPVPRHKFMSGKNERPTTKGQNRFIIFTLLRTGCGHRNVPQYSLSLKELDSEVTNLIPVFVSALRTVRTRLWVSHSQFRIKYMRWIT